MSAIMNLSPQPGVPGAAPLNSDGLFFRQSQTLTVNITTKLKPHETAESKS